MIISNIGVEASDFYLATFVLLFYFIFSGSLEQLQAACKHPKRVKIRGIEARQKIATLLE
jgi:hypothetical protein